MKVHILLPSLISLRHILERLKSLDNHVTLAANMIGELRMSVSSDSVDLTTFYRGLINPIMGKILYTDIITIPLLRLLASKNEDPMPLETRESSILATAQVDIRDLLKIISAQVMQPSNVVCCIMEHHAVVFYVHLNHESLYRKTQQSMNGCDSFSTPLTKDTSSSCIFTYYLPIKL